MIEIEDNKRNIALWFPILIIVMAGVAAAADDPQARAITEKVDVQLRTGFEFLGGWAERIRTARSTTSPLGSRVRDRIPLP